MKKILSLVVAAIITVGISNTVYAQNNYNVSRLYGMDRYKTSVNISNKFNSNTLENVIVASGKNFPDALAGSVLSKKLNAPILLIGSTANESKDCIEYINNHLDKNGTIYILGGQASVNEEFINNMKSQGYKNFVRLGGKNRFETNKHIVNFTNVEKNTPIVIANAYGFADALSVSSIAASKGYPIIMTSNSNLSNEAKNMIKTIAPSEVYVIGGYASVGDNVINEIKTLVPSLESKKIIKLAGKTRYETSLNVCKYFNMDTDAAVIANGTNFPDALSGSALATKFNAPIILTNGQDITSQKEFLDGKSYKNIYLLGGRGSVDFTIEYLLKGSENITKEERDYIDRLLGNCNKYTTDSTNTANNVMNIIDGIFNEDILADLEDPNKVYGVFDKFEKAYNNYKTTLIAYRENLINLKNETANMTNLNGLEIFRIEYTNSIDIEVKNLDKLIQMISSYENSFKDIKNAISSKDESKIDEYLQKIQETNVNGFNEITGLEDDKQSINKLEEKLVDLKNIMN
ncbi:cell wall-binding repeat-containing protein [Clostridium lundense]|uniref:cell wall-binding repeat-containing protein n=1 Tax=Clostridium lundense TaxID=319475 RepID=UPI000486F5E3|nr:cell wall-binding repeat-containing protein [Clostridium lundense]